MTNGSSNERATVGEERLVWHALTVAATSRALDTGDDGLSPHEVEVRRRRYGANVLPAARLPGLPAIFLRQFRSPLIYLLLAAGGVSLVLEEYTDAIFILAVLLFNAGIGTFQEWRAQASAKALQSMVRTYSVVIRDGRRHQIDGADLVPGDRVALDSGARVPADVRLVSASRLQMDESLLTGESTPVAKRADAVLGSDTPLADRTNMLFAGSTVLTGRAEGIVVATGLAAEVGEIARTLATATHTIPALARRMSRFAWIIAVGALGVIAVVGAAQFAQGVPLGELFLIAVALAVGAIPEGLPVAVTVTLAIASNRMARRNAIVRQLTAVEGLGSCTLIASDKTGTLTRNELTVRRLYVPGLGGIEISGDGYSLDGDVSLGTQPLSPEALDRLHRIAIAGTLCNEASLEARAGGQVEHFGDTVDVAFLVLARKLGFEREALLAEHRPVGEIPYEPQQRFAASFNLHWDDTVAHVKGAAETLLPMCRNVDQDELLEAVEHLAAEGYRVLAVASGRIDAIAEPSAEDLCGLDFLGLVGLIDPSRPEVPAALRACREAGITVTMVTGDHPTTAFAIARELGLSDDPTSVVTGAELATLSDDPDRFDDLAARARIFARTTPLQKLAIVESLQRSGHYVAVTGDGVNDAPALAKAHIGVAMGRSGTDVAREASDVILADDNFASIVAGVEEGRVAYDNVRKVIYLLISTGFGEIVLFLLSIAFALPIPLYAAQLLWLNLVTNGIQDIALAFEKGEPGILRRPPRSPRERVFDRRMIEQTLVAGTVMGCTAFGFFYWALATGWSEFEARNALLLLMVLFENVHAFNTRSETRSAFRVPVRNNYLLIGGVMIAQGVHIMAMYLPGLSTALRIEPISPARWAMVAGVALILLVAVELHKRICRV